MNHNPFRMCVRPAVVLSTHQLIEFVATLRAVLGRPYSPRPINEEALWVSMTEREERRAAISNVDSDRLAVRSARILRWRFQRGDTVEAEITDGEQHRLRVKQRHSAPAELAHERDAAAATLAADRQTRCTS